MPLRRVCPRSGLEFEISDTEIAFYKRMGVPLPDLSPEERLREVSATRNERKLYRRTCDATGKEIISAYHPDSPFKVYRSDIWWGDSWDAMDYGREFDFNRTFFEQFAALQKVVPREGTSVVSSENCEYNSHFRDSKNGYLNALGVRNQDVYYSYWVADCKSAMDSMSVNRDTLCYQNIDTDDCYQCVVLQNSDHCHECHFSYALKNCKHCLFSSNLIGKEYYVFNKPVGKAQFEKEKANIINGSWESYQKAHRTFSDLRRKAIHRAVNLRNCENVIGDRLSDSKNCEQVFAGFGNENCFNIINLVDAKDSYNGNSIGGPGSEMTHYCCVARASHNLAFCTYVWLSSDLRYCDSMNACHNCFGCIGLKHKDYCILNKQYTKEEYETLVPKIIEHMKNPPHPSTSSRSGPEPSGPKAGSSQGSEWGRFFPPALSPFAYNETASQDCFPLKKEEALKMGFRWLDYESPAPKVDRVIPSGQLPDSLSDIPDDILNWAIQCEATGKPFKIIPQELKFYREMNLPIPRRHPEQRHLDRWAQRNPYKLWHRKCAKCNSEIWSSYSPGRPETVYCEKCYLEEVY